jgi:tetratricopeptide (TPR) repeat protein
VSDDRVASVESIIRTQGLTRPPGRPASSLDLREAQAVVRALHGPSDVVIAEYRQRVAAAPDAAEARYLLGRVLQTIGKTEAARTELEAAARGAALTDRVDRPLGSIYLTLGDLDAAKDHLARQVARQPGDAMAHRELGRTLDAKGDRDAALAEFQRAVALAPDLGESQRLLGLALGRSGDEVDGLYHLALASRLAGDLPQAYRHFQRVKDLMPEGDRRYAEVEGAMEELQPLVARAERQPSRRFSPVRPSVLRR